MRLTLSIRQAWYGLIAVVSLLPVVVLLVWGGVKYYDLMQARALQEEGYYKELSLDHVKLEVSRLITLLQNKSDPMAYTLARENDQRLLGELLRVVIAREPSVHTLLVLSPEGYIINGLESHSVEGSDHTLQDLQIHWPPDVSTLPVKFVRAMQGETYVGPVEIHSEGAFFSISVPIGPHDNPLGVLLADIDANVLWEEGLSYHLKRPGVDTYLVDNRGILLNYHAESGYSMGKRLDGIPIVQAFMNGQTWPWGKTYHGLSGRPVFGVVTAVKGMNWGIIAETDREQFLQPLRSTLVTISASVAGVILLLVWLGLFLANRIVRSISSVSSAFERVGRQDYTPCKVTSSLKEIKALVSGFNRMVAEIGASQHDLRQAAVVFESTAEGIMVTDMEHKVVAVNKSFSRITGYSAEEVVGRNPSILASGQHDKAFYQVMWRSIEETGQWQGEIWNRRKTGEAYPQLLSINIVKDKDSRTTHHVGVFSDISSIKDTERKLTHLAHHDPLTGLPNRLLFGARLEQVLQRARREGKQVAVLFIDLDRFKNINDSMGHAKGDKLLQAVAQRLSDCVRAEDTTARLGGDEFVLIIEELGTRQDAALVAETILGLFEQSFQLDDQEVFIDASIGVSLYPQDGKDVETLLRNADAAMYRAKAEGRHNYQFYTADLTDKAFERLTMDADLRYALERDEFRLYYQPQFSLKDGGLLGFEALLRWHHPERGIILPGNFIHVAEETGLILPIGEWVLRTACKQHCRWLAAGHPALKMAVNLSARQFQKPGLVRVISEILAETGMDAQCLELELTESIIMRDAETTIQILQALHQMGIELSIDDFGTGYSSLSYMKRFPISRVKIDRSFIRDIPADSNDAEMVLAIIVLGHSMKLEVIAEGVESEEQLRYLQEQGCDAVQGYLYSHPVPADELEQLFEAVAAQARSRPSSVRPA